MIDRNTETFADTGEEKIAGLLRTLPSVSAPSDFDFRVRARIAKGRPAVRTSWMPKLAGIAVPAVLLVGLGGYFGTGMFRQPPPQVVSTTLEPPVVNSPIIVSQPAASESAPSANEIAKNMVKPITPANTATALANKKKDEILVRPTPSGGSLEDQALTESKVINMKLVQAGVRLSGKKVVAAPVSSGFQTGDVVISSSSSSVTVKRDGKTVQIALK